MIEFSIFVIDDELSIRESLKYKLQKRYLVKTFENAEDALATMKHEVTDLILLDIGLPGMGGVEALKKIREEHPEIIVIMITAYESVRTVIESMKLGAFDYIIKPLRMTELMATIEKALSTIRLRKEVQQLQAHYIEENIPVFVGESQAVEEMMDFVNRVAQSPVTPVLISGETGTGKELIAAAIHYRSPNFQGPFVSVNCAAIPRNLIESELFGYTKGAFSGALASGKQGLIEAASGGTLFLDEVGDMSVETQTKMLRFLENGTFFKLGGTREVSVRTRVISATNRDLEAMIEEGTFRRDLFFRLGVVKVEVPSLIQRREDILPLAIHFLYHFSQQFEKPIQGLTKEAEELLKRRSWIGNVRELRNMMERGVLAATGRKVGAKDLGIAMQDANASASILDEAGRFAPLPPEGINLPAVETGLARHFIAEAIQRAEGNESQAARLLQLNHHTFRYRKKKLGL